METDDEKPAIMGKILVEAPSGPINANEVICILLHKNEENDVDDAKVVLEIKEDEVKDDKEIIADVKPLEEEQIIESKEVTNEDKEKKV